MELSEQEKELIERAQLYKQIQTEEKVSNKKKKLLLHPAFWALVLIVIPIVITILILTTSSQIDGLLSSGVIEFIPNFEEGFIQEVQPIHQARISLIGGVWTLYIIVALLLVILEIVLRSSSSTKKKSGEKK